MLASRFVQAVHLRRHCRWRLAAYIAAVAAPSLALGAVIAFAMPTWTLQNTPGAHFGVLHPLKFHEGAITTPPPPLCRVRLA